MFLTNRCRKDEINRFSKWEVYDNHIAKTINIQRRKKITLSLISPLTKGRNIRTIVTISLKKSYWSSGFKTVEDGVVDWSTTPTIPRAESSKQPTLNHPKSTGNEWEV